MFKHSVISTALLTVVMAASLSACSSVNNARIQSERAEGRQSLRIGMTVETVEQMFGNPKSVHRYKGGATSSGIEELRGYTNRVYVGYIEGKVASWK